jgi:transposase
MMWFNKNGHFDKSGKIGIRRCPMQSQKRRQYTAEFKREAIRLITEHGYGVTEAARNLGLHAQMLGRWKRQAEHQTNGSNGGNGQMSAEHEELLRLRKENQRLRMEREILKKATVFFAKESS